MITLRIPIVLIMKVLFRIWQFVGLLFTVGMSVIFLSLSDVSITEIDMNYLIDLKMFLLLGAVFAFAEWVTDRFPSTREVY